MNTILNIPPLSPNIEIYPMDGGKYMIHQTEFDKRILISGHLHDIIHYFDKEPGTLTKEILSRLGITTEEVEQLYTNLARYGIVAGNDTVSKHNPASYLTFKTTLIPEKIVRPISFILAPLFTHWFFSASVCIFAAFIGSLMIDHLDFRSIYNHLDGMSLLKLQGIFMSGLILHEFGHAAACKRYGANPGPIGFGFYLFTPVLFADVSDAWKLKKYQRIIVDLGGFYLQLLFCVILGVFYLTTHSPIFIPAIALNLISIVVNLNPFFRYDGYWALSDGLGIYNLRPKALQKVNSLFKRIRGKVSDFTLHSSLDYFLFIYGFICYCFLFFFLFYIVVKNPQSVLYFPINLYHFVENLFQQELDSITLKNEFRRLLIPLVFYIIVIKYIIRNRLKIKGFFKNKQKQYEL
jgi:putative peptide zinc metalloprotease protein